MDFLQDVHNIIRNKGEEIKNKHEKEQKGIKNATDKELNTFLELYIKASGGASGFTNVELREETLVLLLAGTDTSAVGSAFTSLMLARHPEVQNNVYEEIREVLGDSNRSVSAEDLPRLKYLEAVIKESLRLYPPVPMIVRKADKDIKLLHRNPVYWGKDAEEFRPERFLESNLKHPAAFIPFSYGPRSCLGKGFLRTNNSKTKTSSFLKLFRFYNSQTAILYNVSRRFR
ncbi:Cytochrome P450 [Operophtera brumata]|uniref:Cytochrome P450 n=1 Tax=Operophtera brumata TaxID=104452 RepID=A0A0L7KML1_OPEBR|nr:Cytochrome P450 [Operophtera brumata]